MLHTPSPASSAATCSADAGLCSAPRRAAPPPAWLARYFERIGYDGPAAPTLDTLAALQAAHIAAIPFEGIDALTGVGIDIAPHAIEAKLIDRRRGGYCFEQNGLFLRVLQTIGFEAEGLLGRVRWMLPDDAPPSPRTHMVSRVTLDGRAWLADVGFGSMVPTRPLAIDSEAPQPTAQEDFRVIRRGREYRIAARIGADWATLYDIDDLAPPTIDYEVGNWYTSTNPASHFTQRLVAARTTGDARHSLIDNRLTIRHRDGTVERRYLSADGIAAALTDVFLLRVEPGWRAAIERAATAEIVG